MRRNDYSLTEGQQELADVLRAQLAPENAPAKARRAEPSGFDRELWSVLAHNGLLRLPLSEEDGGDGGGLVELVIAGIEVGRGIAPVPLLDHLVGLRLLAAARRAGAPVDDWDAALAGRDILSIAPISTWELGAELVPSGALSRRVLARHGDALVILTRTTPPPAEPNPGSAPLAWWRTDDDTLVTQLLSGDTAESLWRTAQDEWRVATAAALAGIVDAVGEIARRYAMERQAFGGPIARFQAISHALVGIHQSAQTTRNLTFKAAWLLEHDPAYRPELPAMALLHASRSALTATHRAVHAHGGFGITLESDVSLYFRRAAAWGLAAGGSARDFDLIDGAIDRIESTATLESTAR